MKVNPEAFKAYDIRGKVPEEVNSELAFAVGRALADFLPSGALAVGHDMRPDSQEFSHLIIEGAIKQGRKVFDLGQCSTDMTYFGVAHLGCVGGAMVTASHNPVGYNGIKLTAYSDGSLVPIGIESGLAEIQSTIENDSFRAGDASGKIEKVDILDDWIAHALEFAPELKPVKVGMDFGNGMAGIFLAPLQKHTKLQLVGLYDIPDGSFPNHPADPLQEKNLQDLKELITNNHLDVGVAFDGDGDRAILVDEKAQMVNPSIIGALIAEKELKEVAGADIVYNGTTSRVLVETIKRNGGKAIISKTGHSFMKAVMSKHKAVFGAESSGHYYFSKNFNADSGLIAALSILQIISDSGKSFSDICKPYREKYLQSGEKNFEVSSKDVVIEGIVSKFTDGKQSRLDGITVNYPDWWFNIRSSNTEPFLRLNVEANSRALLEEKLAELTNLIKTLDV